MDESKPVVSLDLPNRLPTTKLAIRDPGSFANLQSPSDAEIKDHRSQGGTGSTVLIGLHVPKQHGRHRRRHHRRHSHRGDNEDGEIFKEVSNPSQRVQDLLGDEDEDDEGHRTHDLFCEMEELFGSGEDREWKETARWVKFEEDVEEGGERWSKPHVATLSLHSLFELRCCILSGTVMFDMDAFTLSQVVDLVLDNMVASKQLEETLKEEVRDVILRRHRHQNDKRQKHGHDDTMSSKMNLPLIRSLADIGRKYSEPKNLSVNGDHDRFPGAKSTPNFQKMLSQANENHSKTVAEGLSTTNSSNPDLENIIGHKANLHFMKKIPPGSEAANILVGEVDFLNHQIVAFIRLSKAEIMGDLTEVPVPTKFIFILLGPTGNQAKFHEIGRSIATLMSDEVFHDVAYHARNKEDLLTGIDEFLDQVTVLPPGEWDPSIRIEPPKNIPSQGSRKQAGGGTPLPNGKAVTEEKPESHADPTLVRSGRPFGGIVDDVRRKVKVYGSDFKDALHVQTVASFVFLYFACLTPIITFGGLLGEATHNNMAALESILAGSVCGIVYALCAGQPLTILGSTGPILVFEKILYQTCFDNGWDYLELRWWIGIWSGLILLTLVALDASALVRYITRFTEESFALLISLIFIKEAFFKLIQTVEKAPINFDPSQNLTYLCECINITSTDNVTFPNVTFPNTDVTFLNTTSLYSVTYEATSVDWWKDAKKHCANLEGVLEGPGCGTPVYVADVFFLSCLLFIWTFTVAYVLKLFRNHRFFPTVVRCYISDFAVLIAIVTAIGIDAAFGLATPKLEVPHEFAPTNPERGWVVSPVGKNPWYLCIGAIIPSLLVTILIFMDQQITAVIVNRKENKLKKGHGYHLDLLIVAVLIIINSALGLPWFVAATVLSINHVQSLKKESTCTAPGERPKFLGVREQRVTGISIFLMIGLSVFFTKVLMYIPMAVLYGVFLYMGVSSLRGMQLVHRVMILFMPAKYQPDYTYLRHVRTKKVHLFTFIQVFCLAVLWIIKEIKKISIAFPLMVLAMCFVRVGMEKLFEQRELMWLDDIMPEAHKREEEDEQNKKEQEKQRLSMSSQIEGSGTVQVPLSSGNIINIPVERITLSSEISEVNISEEMSKLGVWKSIVANESASNLIDMEKRDKKPGYPKKRSKKPHSAGRLPAISSDPETCELSEEHHHKPSSSSSKKKNTPVRFYIDEDEKEHLMHAPEIVVDPPSDTSVRFSLSTEEDSKV